MGGRAGEILIVWACIVSPHRLNSLYESNEIAVFLIRVKKKNKGKKKQERMIVVISSSKTMTVTQQITARHEKITPAVGVTFQNTQHTEERIVRQFYCMFRVMLSLYWNLQLWYDTMNNIDIQYHFRYHGENSHIDCHTDNLLCQFFLKFG